MTPARSSAELVRLQSYEIFVRWQRAELVSLHAVADEKSGAASFIAPIEHPSSGSLYRKHSISALPISQRSLQGARSIRDVISPTTWNPDSERRLKAPNYVSSQSVPAELGPGSTSFYCVLLARFDQIYGLERSVELLQSSCKNSQVERKTKIFFCHRHPSSSCKTKTNPPRHGRLTSAASAPICL